MFEALTIRDDSNSVVALSNEPSLTNFIKSKSGVLDLKLHLFESILHEEKEEGWGKI